jgi:hypothetical protein
MRVKEILLSGDLAPITVFMSRPPLAEKTGVPYFANFAEVEVDTSTGRVETLKLVVINDCGTVMYASGAEAQQVGGQCIGLGEALTEEVIYDTATGVPLNFNWIDYHGGHAGHRAGASRGMEGRRGVRGLRHRRRHGDLHAPRYPERRLQRHRGAGRRDPRHAGKSASRARKGLSTAP